jgi:hypothetical protein
MPTIAATVFPNEAYVRIDADWTDTPSVTYAGVQRTNTVTGEVVTLRPYVAYDSDGNLLLSCSKGLWYDTEPPLNVALSYCLIASGVETALSQNSSFEIGSVAPWTPVGGTFATSITFSHSGSFSGLFTPDGTTASGGIVHPAIAGIVADVALTGSAWVLSPQGYNAVQIQITLANADGTFTTIYSDPEIIDDNEWRFLTVTATPTQAASVSDFRVVALGIAPNTTLFYYDQVQLTQEQAVTVNVCTTVTVTDTTNVRLKDPNNPCNDLTIGLCSPMVGDCGEDDRISYAGQAPDVRPPNTMVIDPVNREFPLPVNRVRRSPRTELRLIAHDCDARDAIVQINHSGDVLLLQLPAAYCQDDRYITVGDETETRISIDQREPFRLMSIPYITVERQNGPANGVCGTRIQDLCDIYTTWQSMVIAGLTWRDLLLGAAGNFGPGSDFAALRTWTEVNTEFVDWTAVSGGGRTWTGLLNGL